MHLSRLYIKNYKSIKELDLTLEKQKRSCGEKQCR